jgi:hypothetical protein
MSEVRSYRRYCFLKWRIQKALGEGTAEVWRHEQLKTSGTELPASFPSRSALVASGYSTVEDIDGADAGELLEYAGLGQTQAAEVLTAVARLL